VLNAHSGGLLSAMLIAHSFAHSFVMYVAMRLSFASSGLVLWLLDFALANFLLAFPLVGSLEVLVLIAWVAIAVDASAGCFGLLMANFLTVGRSLWFPEGVTEWSSCSKPWVYE